MVSSTSSGYTVEFPDSLDCTQDSVSNYSMSMDWRYNLVGTILVGHTQSPVFSPQHCINRACRCMSVIPSTQQAEADGTEKFKVILGYRIYKG